MTYRHITLFSRFFYKYGQFVAAWPVFFAALPLLLTLGLALGCFTHIKLLSDDLRLYVPENGPANSEERVLKELFNLDDASPYFASRRFDSRRAGYIIATAVNGSNVANHDCFAEVSLLWKRVESLMVVGEGKWASYSHLCVRESRFQTCVHNLLLSAFTRNEDSLRGLTYPTNLTIYGEIPTSRFLGGVRSTDKGYVISARAVLLPYQLRYNNPLVDSQSQLWEARLAEFLKTYDTEHVKLHWFTSETLAEEAVVQNRQIKRLIGPMFALVAVFTLVCSLKSSGVTSKPWAAAGGVVAISCAILSSIGLLAIAKQPFTSVAFFMPFIVFSVGVDNIFILLAAWHKTDPRQSVPNRLGASLSKAGISMTVTCLTDSISFAIGCIVDFPSVRLFCLYAAVAISLSFLYQLTMFTAVMAFDGFREEARRNAFTFMKVKTVVQPQSKPRVPFTERMWSYYADVITQPGAQVVVLVLFFVYLGTASFGCAHLRIGLHEDDLLGRSSQAREALRLFDENFADYAYSLHVVFTNLSSQLDYNGPFWLRLKVALEPFENTHYSAYADSWLRVFLAYCRTNSIHLTPANFLLQLELFLANPLYVRYQSDVNINQINTRIENSRFLIRMRNVHRQNRTSAADHFRRIAAQSKLNVTTYHESFVLADQYNAVLPNTLLSLAAGAAAVIAISLLLVPKPSCAAWVCLTIISINVGIIGFMTFWSVKLDFVSMVTIIMSIGLCVDYSVHIAYHFACHEGSTVKASLLSALSAVGTPIIQAAFSSMLGVVLLLLVDSYVYSSFLKTVLLVIWLGVLHGLLILPVLLTLCHAERWQPNKVREAQTPQPYVTASAEFYPRTVQTHVAHIYEDMAWPHGAQGTSSTMASSKGLCLL